METTTFTPAPRWISGDTKERTKPAPVLSKDFTLDGRPAEARLVLAVAGWHEARVNGARLGEDVLSPVTCQPDRRLSSVSYDVAPLLRAGANRVEVLLGNGWWNCFTGEVWGFKDASWMAAPAVRGELLAGGVPVLATDGSWEAHDSPIAFNALRGGETYDARLEGLRPNARPATVVPYVPWGAVSAEDAAPCRAFESFEPKASRRLADGSVVYDFGTNIAGWCEIEVEGEAGAKVTIDYDELLRPDGSLLGNVGSLVRDPRPTQHDEYILAGRAGGEAWHPRFTYHGFRYARVAVEGAAALRAIRSRFVHAAFREAGALATSDPLFAKLQDATRRSYLSNFAGIPTDCPHREKNGWTGDAQLAMETGLWNFDAKAGYLHFLRMALDAQRPNGAVPCILPASEKFGFFWGSGPAWDAVLFEIPWQIYRFYGDDAPAREAYAAMGRYLDFILEKREDPGIVRHGLGDWCRPCEETPLDAAFTDTAFVYSFCRRLAFWARRFGDGGAAARHDAAAASVRDSFNQAFYMGGGLYADDSLTALSAPLHFGGLCAAGEEKAVLGRLVARVRGQGHRPLYGILGAKWAPRALAAGGYVDDAWRLFTQREFPSYAKMVEEEDTLWETFAGDVSHNHIMFGDLSAWAYEYVAGIVPLAPGFRKVAFRPHAVEGVESFSATHLTPYGEVASGWRREGGVPVFFCSAPDGVEVAERPD